MGKSVKCKRYNVAVLDRNQTLFCQSKLS